MTAWVFPGQGAQRRGMGAGLFERFAHLVAQADEQLGYSVAELCLQNPQDRLSSTRYAQPALFVTSALAGLARSQDDPEVPTHLAGHSLGEYAALFVAGSFDFVTGVRIVQWRAELMARATGGGMLAVVRAPVEDVLRALAEGGHAELDVANHNAPDQVVLSGPTDALAAAARDLRERGVGRSVPLAVSAAFHSRSMAAAARDFADHLAGVTLAPPHRTVLSNVTAGPYGDADVAALLAEQIERPVRWSDIVRRMLADGVTEVVELGPGTVLTDLWRAARRRHHAVPSPASASARVPRPPSTVPAAVRPGGFDPGRLGDEGFRRDHGLRHAYLAGSMYHGVSSTDLVTRMVRAGYLGFFGSGGLRVGAVDGAISRLERDLGPGATFGMNLLCTLDDPRHEEALVECYLKRGVRLVEASAYPQLTPALLRWRFTGAHRDRQGRPVAVNRLIAKVSRPEVATAFLSPPPQALLDRLVAAGELTADEAELARSLPVSNDICVESDSGGHTDAGVALTLLPAMLELRRELAARYPVPTPLRVGAAGGLGSPEALAAVFVLGADFVVTGSINQCTPEAGTSDAVKDLLAGLDVQDTTYAPAGDLFEIGARVQVVRKGTLFAARANKLYQLYRRYSGLESLDVASRRSVQEAFGRPLDDVWTEVAEYLAGRRPDELARAQEDPRKRMALVFRWYFRHTSRAALNGDADRVNYQIHCGPAMGSFNRWVRGTDLETWHARHVDVVADRLMRATADLLGRRLAALGGKTAPAAAQH
ncbi:MAG TPA: ACP S-malonyltransferase [Kineosporiaceae bacterium]